MTRQAASYREGRVLLAGDAAHVHPPQGGQGLDTGVQDAVNLGWKLAQVVTGRSPDALLDTYHAERHPVGAWILRHTMVEVVLARPDERHQAVRADVTEMLGMDEPRRHFAGKLSGLDIRYDLGVGHPLLGRRMPDLDLRHGRWPDARVRAAARGSARAPRPRRTRPVRRLPLGRSGPAGRGHHDAAHDGTWELPVIGAVDAPAAVLIRPDGYVAWAGDLGDPDLPDALTTWFGAAVPASA